MSIKDFIPNDGSLWSIRAVDISGNYNQKLSPLILIKRELRKLEKTNSENKLSW